jgi:hypothetical protein
MKGQPIVAIHRETGKLMPIGQVTHTGLKCGCVCYDCEEALTAVLNTPYQKHFRHRHNLNCNPTSESQLHLMAKVIIEQNNRIFLPGKGMVSYTDPVVEVRCRDLVPDVTIKVDGKPVYIEIVVTNPISPSKIQKYKSQQAKVLVIHLPEEDREMDYDTLTFVVLEEPDVRNLLSYPYDKEKCKETGAWVAAVIGLMGAGFFLWDRFGRRRKR